MADRVMPLVGQVASLLLAPTKINLCQHLKSIANCITPDALTSPVVLRRAFAGIPDHLNGRPSHRHEPCPLGLERQLGKAVVLDLAIITGHQAFDR